MTGPAPAPGLEQGPDGGLIVRRSGKAPLRFQGQVVAEASAGDGATREATPCCVIHVAQRQRGGWVAAVQVLSARLRGGGVKTAASETSVEALARFLETYDPAPDMGLRVRAHPAGVSPAAMALAEVALRQEMEMARRAMRGAAEQIFAQWDAIAGAEDVAA